MWMRRLANLFAFDEDLRATGIVDRAVDTAAAEQRRVCSVDDRGYVVTGYVASQNTHAAIEECWKRFRHQKLSFLIDSSHSASVSPMERKIFKNSLLIIDLAPALRENKRTLYIFIAGFGADLVEHVLTS